MYLPNEFIAKERIEVANKLMNHLGLLFTAASQEAKIFCWAKGSLYKIWGSIYSFCGINKDRTY